MAKTGDVTLGPGGLPGTPRDLAPTRTATHSERNVAQGQYNDVTGFTVRGFLTDRDPDAPILPASYAPSFRVQYFDPLTGTWQLGTWTSLDDGRPHPCEFHAGVYSADGTYPLTVAVRAITLTAIDLAGTGSVTLLKDGVAVSSAISGEGHQVLGTPVSYAGSPALGTPGNKIGITVAGTDAGDPLYIVLWEA